MKTKELLERLAELGFEFNRYGVSGNFWCEKYINNKLVQTGIQFLLSQPKHANVFDDSGEVIGIFYSGKEALLALYKQVIKERLGI